MISTSEIAAAALTADELVTINGGDAPPCGSDGTQSLGFRVGQALSHLGEFMAGVWQGLSDPTPCR